MTERDDKGRRRADPAEDQVSLGDIASAGANVLDPTGLMRLTASSLRRAVQTVTKDSVDNVTGVADQLAAGVPVSQIVDAQLDQVRVATLGALGIAPGEATSQSGHGARPMTLRERGDALLQRSWNAAGQVEHGHPAFDRILGELIPDEARILRFLAVAGPQPSIDVRTYSPFGIGSQRLAAGVSFVTDMAGCAWPDRSRQYLGNLNRLGLVRFSNEPVEDFRRYSLLEAHPETVEAMHRAWRTVSVYRSIYLSVFGQQFCQQAFTLDGYDAGGWANRAPVDRYWGKGPRLP